MDSFFPNKKPCLKHTDEYFILSMDSVQLYTDSDPIILILINSNYGFSKYFLDKIIDGGVKNNLTKIITSDSVVLRYIYQLIDIFPKIFPNCNCIQINSFENNFNRIFEFIDSIGSVKNIEFKINDYAINFNFSSVNNYSHLFELLSATNFSNIKSIKIINELSEPNILDRIFNIDFIKNLISIRNDLKYNEIKKYFFSNPHEDLNWTLALLNKIHIYTNTINVKYIGKNGVMLLDENLLNIKNF